MSQTGTVFEGWNSGDLPESVSRIYQETVERVRNNIDWYTRSARKKKNLAQVFRLGSLFLLGIGSVIPVFIDITNWSVPASIATLVIAAGTGFIALDRYMGQSTGWMRFITTEMLLKARLEAFEYESLIERMSWADGKPTLEQARMMVNRCAGLRNEITTVVRDETQVWVQEFQSNLKTLDENYKALAEASRPGAISLTVENGDQYPGGWDLLADDRFIGTYKGTTAAIGNVLPGFRKLVIVAKDDKNQTQCETPGIVSVSSGQLVEARIALPENR